MSILMNAIIAIAGLGGLIYLKTTKDKKTYEKFYLPLLIVIVAGGIGIVGTLVNSGDGKLESIARPNPDEEAKEIEANVTYDNKVYEIGVQVSPKKYTQEEIFQIFEQSYKIITQTMTTDEEPLTHVTKKLNLMTSVNQTGVSVSWNLNETELIEYDGTLNYDLIDKNGTKLTLNLMLTFEDYYKTNTSYYDVDLVLYQREYTEDEKNQMLIQDALTDVDKKDGEEVVLPTDINNKDIEFNEQKSDTYKHIGILGLVGAIAIFIAKNKDEQDKIEKRKQTLELEYSEMVSKITLLAGAGMTIQGAWEKIVTDYLKEKEEGDFKRKEVFEEMTITYYQLKSGLSEVKAYEEFGRRCNTQLYLQFGSLLSQNLRKGTANLLVLLENAANEAFIHRKQLAKKQGEEAGTKLLIPMMMMLGIIMIIVIFPAFVSFNI